MRNTPRTIRECPLMGILFSRGPMERENDAIKNTIRPLAPLLLLVACGTEPELPDYRLTVVPDCTSRSCAERNPDAGGHIYADFSVKRVWRASGADAPFTEESNEAVTPPDDCVDNRWAVYVNDDFTERLEWTGAPFGCQTKRWHVETGTRIWLNPPADRDSRFTARSAVIETWDWYSREWVQCWSREPFISCEIRYSPTPETPDQ